MAGKIITENEADDLRELEELTARVIAVDHFDPAQIIPHYMTSNLEKAAAE